MAGIDFPAGSPGATYYWEGNDTTYSWIVSGSSGYWTVLSPGSVGAANGAEVTAGTDSVKYVTSKAIDDSQVFKEIFVKANTGIAHALQKGDAITLSSSGNYGLSVTRSGDGWNVSQIAGSSSQYGGVRLSDSVTSGLSVDGKYAATPKAVRSAYDLAATKAKLNGAALSGTRQWTITGEQSGGKQLQLMSGSYSWPSGNGVGHTLTFPIAFAEACLHFGATPNYSVGSTATLLESSLSRTSFTGRLNAHNNFSTPNQIRWFAIGY